MSIIRSFEVSDSDQRWLSEMASTDRSGRDSFPAKHFIYRALRRSFPDFQLADFKNLIIPLIGEVSGDEIYNSMREYTKLLENPAKVHTQNENDYSQTFFVDMCPDRMSFFVDYSFRGQTRRLYLAPDQVSEETETDPHSLIEGSINRPFETMQMALMRITLVSDEREATRSEAVVNASETERVTRAIGDAARRSSVDFGMLARSMSRSSGSIEDFTRSLRNGMASLQSFEDMNSYNSQLARLAPVINEVKKAMVTEVEKPQKTWGDWLEI